MKERAAVALVLAALGAAAVVATPRPAAGQAAGAPPASPGSGRPAAEPSRDIAGRVFVLRGGRDVPLAGAWVTLHRVGRAAAGPVDSVRSDARGRFAFRVSDILDGANAYFVSATWDGLTNFSGRIAADRADGGPVDLAMYDTTSTGPPLPVASRHVLVSAPNPDGSRTVSELFVLLNAGDRTRVGSGHRATFSAALPAGVVRPRPADGDVPAASLRFTPGRVQSSAPVAPGTRRVAVEYDLPPGATTLAVEPNGGSDLLEILVEDSAGVATGPGLREEAPAAAGGRMFRRFLANAVPDSAHIVVRLPASGATAAMDPVLIVVGAIALSMIAVLVAACRRPGSPGAAPGSLAAAGPPG
ncbi:MAG: hypothetical protein U9Q74_02255 [Gemmatimonadota bacterium]|nr:hypothetical protein [Gemmatimonadota bacterium]